MVNNVVNLNEFKEARKSRERQRIIKRAEELKRDRRNWIEEVNAAQLSDFDKAPPPEDIA